MMKNDKLMTMKKTSLHCTEDIKEGHRSPILQLTPELFIQTLQTPTRTETDDPPPSSYHTPLIVVTQVPSVLL